MILLLDKSDLNDYQLFIILHGISYKKPNIIDRISNFDLKYWTIIIILILGAVVFFFDGNPDDFIYFRF